MTRARMPLAVAVLGLGEAGGTIASGLAAAGCAVRGSDPAVPVAPPGVQWMGTPTEAVVGAELVLSLTTAAHALDAAESIAPSLGAGQLYADLNTTAPRSSASSPPRSRPREPDSPTSRSSGPCPHEASGRRRSRLGDGAERFAELVRPLGMPVEIVGASRATRRA